MVQCSRSDTQVQRRSNATADKTAPGSCHDCGAHGLESFYRLSRLGYNLCPACFQMRSELAPRNLGEKLVASEF